MGDETIMWLAVAVGCVATLLVLAALVLGRV